MQEEHTQQLTDGLANGRDDIVRKVIAKAVEHHDAARTADQVIEPGSIEGMVLSAGLAATATGPCTLSSNDLAEGHGGAMPDLPTGIEEINLQDLAQPLEWPFQPFILGLGLDGGLLGDDVSLEL